MRRTLLLLVVVLSGHQAVRGQSTCAQTLRLAQSIYEQGRLHELPQLLENCLTENKFNDEEKVSAYKLLTLTYIYLEEPVKADEMMLELLRTDNEFKVNDVVDPAEFVALYKTFRTKPIYRIGGKLAGVTTQPSFISADYADDGTNTYTSALGFAGTITTEIPLSNNLRKFTLNPELAFQVLKFNGTNGDADSVRVTEKTETETWVSLPVSLQYTLHEKGFTSVFVAAGLSADYLLSSSVRIVSNRAGESPIPENSIDVMALRHQFNSGLMLSAGYKRKIGTGFLVAELRCKMGLLSVNSRDDTYAHNVLVWDYKFVDGIFKLNTLSLSIGYVINKYNPKKLTSK